MKRREFIQKSTLSAGLITLGQLNLFADTQNPPVPTEHKPGFIPKRKYGKTDIMLSIIGFGGIVVLKHEQDKANRIVAEALEKGVNYYDVAPSYGKTKAELILGPALQPYRKKAFLACKTAKRKYDEAK